MEATTFLNILGASVGFISAAFFALGSVTLTAKDIYSTVVVRHTINEHWYKAVSNQRAEYLAGSALLFLAFLIQLIANLVPKGASYSFLNSPVCAWLSLGLLVLLLLMAAILFRRLAAASCSRKVRDMWEQKIASYGQKNAN
ncbi:hypothetical protein [Polaromonas sp. UC242_47]|uniref:hypothetical protein n=1 Tax=Polaromonas sp. UC242_47 TaxID=3374626 RepID=UPI0037926C5A